MKKYLPEKRLNGEINNSKIIEDRIVWEMSGQQIFFTKNKEFIAEQLEKFLVTNKEAFGNESEDTKERFKEMAKAIRNIDEKEYPYFLFKNTSVDDTVEYWFNKYNEETDEDEDRSLLDVDKYVTEFVFIKDNEIVMFIGNTELNAEKLLEFQNLDSVGIIRKLCDEYKSIRNKKGDSI